LGRHRSPSGGPSTEAARIRRGPASACPRLSGYRVARTARTARDGAWAIAGRV